MELLDHLEHFRDAMDAYHDLLMAEMDGIGPHRYLKAGAGLRLPEKPRKNVKRIQAAMDAAQEQRWVQARTWLLAVYGAWRDHVGLHDTYLDADQMSLEHVLSHFGGYLTAEHFALHHDETVRTILQSMAAAQMEPPIQPDAFSLGVALHVALTEVDKRKGV